MDLLRLPGELPGECQYGIVNVRGQKAVRARQPPGIKSCDIDPFCRSRFAPYWPWPPWRRPARRRRPAAGQARPAGRGVLPPSGRNAVAGCAALDREQKYATADEEKRAELLIQFKELKAKGDKLEPILFAAAEKAYAEGAQRRPASQRFLLRLLGR